MSYWGDGALGFADGLPGGVGRGGGGTSIFMLLAHDSAHLVRVEICFGHDVGCFCWGQDCVCEELLDEVGVVSAQELRELSVDVLVDVLQDFIHFVLFFKELTHERVH